MDSGTLYTHEYSGDEGTLTVKLKGEIDHHSASVLRRELDELICSRHPKKFLLDLSAVDFMDSSGLGLIMGRYTLLDSFGGETVLLNPTDRIRKILDLAGFGRICRVEVVKRSKGKEGEKNG